LVTFCRPSWLLNNEEVFTSFKPDIFNFATPRIKDQRQIKETRTETKTEGHSLSESRRCCSLSKQRAGR